MDGFASCLRLSVRRGFEVQGSGFIRWVFFVASGCMETILGAQETCLVKGKIKKPQ